MEGPQIAWCQIKCILCVCLGDGNYYENCITYLQALPGFQWREWGDFAVSEMRYPVLGGTARRSCDFFFFNCGPENMKSTKASWLQFGIVRYLEAFGSRQWLVLPLPAYISCPLAISLTLWQASAGKRRLISAEERGCGVCERQKGWLGVISSETANIGTGLRTTLWLCTSEVNSDQNDKHICEI